MALVAVGGYGRRELAPWSDLDLVLLHRPEVEIGEVAASLWYPLWDARAPVDHSVRALDEVTAAAAADVRVALGLLDARHLAGDSAVTLRLRAELLSSWRRDARTNLPRLRTLVEDRSCRVGELAHASVPDLKESVGGLRDATALTALVATWLVDVSHVDLERSRRQLLDLRDVLQDRAGRRTDRVTPELWGPLAEGLGLADEDAAQRHLRSLGRRVTHLSRLTWSRVHHVLTPSAPLERGRAPRLTPAARGVAVMAGEVVLDRRAHPADDPLLLLRAAAVAAERGHVLSPASAARLAAESAPLPDPWPAEARRLLGRMLAAGSGLLPVWETLDETGALRLLLPEWERIRLLPHASAVHRFTVDRHVVETCVEASRLIRRVARPDLLLVAALLHDIGKGADPRLPADRSGSRVDHSVAGAPVAATVATRMGFPPPDVRVISSLVRRHLLLAEVATTRDLGDPATVSSVGECVGDALTLDLLEVLTEADARATGPQAWTGWRAGLVADLASRVRAHLTAEGGTPGRYDAEPASPATAVAVPGRVLADPAYLEVRATPGPEGTRLTVVAPDRPGLLAAVAGTLGLLRASIRSAWAATSEDVAVSVWDVDDPALDEAVVAQRLDAVLAGRVDPGARLTARSAGRADPDLPPSVAVRHDASRLSTVLEVRTTDQPGVVYRTCRALAGLGLDVVSAHVTTWGPQALDVFYLQEPGGVALAEERAASAARAVRRSLLTAATLDA